MQGRTPLDTFLSEHGGDVADLLEEDPATFAEVYAADMYGVAHRNEEREWYDLRDLLHGTKYEVKATHTHIGDKYPENGRFRLRYDQMHSLATADAQGTAWVVFCLFDGEPGEVEAIRVRRMKPSTVFKIVREHGGWTETSHQQFDREKKLGYGVLFDVRK